MTCAVSSFDQVTSPSIKSDVISPATACITRSVIGRTSSDFASTIMYSSSTPNA